MHDVTFNELSLITQLLDDLRALPDVQADLDRLEATGATGDHRHDAQIALRVAGRSISLLVEVKDAVFPRDARDVMWRFRDLGDGPTRRQGKQPLPLLVADSISPGAKALLRAERFGYYDSGGSLYLPAPGAYIYIDKPQPKTFAKKVGSLFSGRRAQVVHALLVKPQDWLGVNELAELAMVSPSTTSQVLTGLERFEWLASRGQGPSKQRQLREPAALLDAWVKHYASLGPPSLRRYFVSDTKAGAWADRIVEALDDHEAMYAISHEAAAQRYSPFLSAIFQVRARLLIGSNAEAALRDMGARAVNEGANLAIIDAKSPGDFLFRERVDGMWLASPVQVYLDLIRGEGRSKEMAEHLRQEKIGF